MSQKKNITNPFYQGDLIFVYIVFFIISVVAVYAAQQFNQYNEPFAMKQSLYYLLGAFIIIVFLYFDLEQLEKLSFYFYLLGILMLIVLKFSPASDHTGLRRSSTVPKAGLCFPGLRCSRRNL